MEKYQKDLESLGITGCNGIPLGVLLSGSLIPDVYDIPQESADRLRALHDIVSEYNARQDPPRKVRRASDAAAYLSAHMAGLDHEELRALYLNGANGVIDSRTITTGSATQTVIDNRRIIGQALACNARAIIIAHNHPSGNPEPSNADIAMTESLKKACDTFDIPLLDHIIITRGRFYSFADEKTTETSDIKQPRQ